MPPILVTIVILLTGAKAPPPAERIVEGDGMVAVQIAGAAGRMRIDPAAPGMPMLAPPYAERAGVKMSNKLGIGLTYMVGPVCVSSSTSAVPVDLGQGVAKQRVGWTTRAFSTAGDGSIGPAGLPEPVVRFALHPVRPGERVIALPMVKIGFPFTLFGKGWVSTYGQIIVGGVPMRVRIDPYQARTLATAGAAVRLAAEQGGVLSGDAVPTEIFFGVERPVRTMTLARPLVLGALSIATLGVRVQDEGRATSIGEANAPAVAPDPDEIVVTAKGKKRDTRRDTLSLGADVLSRCSSVVFDKPAQEIRLSCA